MSQSCAHHRGPNSRYLHSFTQDTDISLADNPGTAIRLPLLFQEFFSEHNILNTNICFYDHHPSHHPSPHPRPSSAPSPAPSPAPSSSASPTLTTPPRTHLPPSHPSLSPIPLPPPHTRRSQSARRRVSSTRTRSASTAVPWNTSATATRAPSTTSLRTTRYEWGPYLNSSQLYQATHFTVVGCQEQVVGK